MKHVHYTCFKAAKLIVPIKNIFLLKNYHIPNNIARDTFTLIFSFFHYNMLKHILS